MLRASISERTTFRWDLAEEVVALQQHGFDTLSAWRPKLSDLEPGEARRVLDAAGIRVSSLQWAGGFTGSEGSTFQESLTDARAAICEAAEIGAAVLLIHTGCRSGHTLGHARRLLQEALASLAPYAEEFGVQLALKPTHPAASVGCGFLTQLEDALRFVRELGHPCLGLALDLWHFGHERDLLSLLPALIPSISVVSLADCRGAPSAAHDRLAPGDGTLPLNRILTRLADAGYQGDVEFEFVAEPLLGEADGPAASATRSPAGATAAAVTAGYHDALLRTRQAVYDYGCFVAPSNSSLPASVPGR
jgi:sugar phosphate isomerase/epimerase